MIFVNTKSTKKGFILQSANKKKIIIGVSSIVLVSLAGTAFALAFHDQHKGKEKEEIILSKTVVKETKEVEENVISSHLTDINKLDDGNSTDLENSTLKKRTQFESLQKSKRLESTQTLVSAENSVSDSPSEPLIVDEIEQNQSQELVPSSDQNPLTENTKPSVPTISNIDSNGFTSYLPATDARCLLENLTYFQKVDDEYFYEDEWGYVVDVKMNQDHVGFIFFDGTTYYSAKNTTYEDILSFVGGDSAQADVEWKDLQTVITKNEKVVQAAADAVYGSGTEESANLYKEILEGGKSTQGYFREF